MMLSGGEVAVKLAGSVAKNTCVVRDELAERLGSLFCGKATAVAACHWHAAKSRLSNPTRARVIMPEKSPSGWMGFFLAERVGFEPTVPLPVHLISSQNSLFRNKRN